MNSITPQDTLIKFGFKFGKNGAHSSRTMMLEELQLLFAATSAATTLQEYQTIIITHNGLNKPTEKTRTLTFRHLKDLYSLDTQYVLFRAFRLFWDLEPEAQGMLALQLAYARDPLFRKSADAVLAHKPGEQITREEIEALLKQDDPERFSPASLKSFAQNINSSWTQAGYLKGKAKKIRHVPIVTPINVSFALFQGYLCGLSGERLFNSVWIKLLQTPLETLQTLASAASYRGLIDYKEAGGVVEVRFDNLLEPDEKKLL